MHRLPNRQSQRLKGYDYSRNGFYFVTIVCQNQTERFGNIVNGEMVLNDAGRMVESVWRGIPEQYNVGIDVFVVMPNHFHGIVVIENDVIDSKMRATTGGSPLQSPQTCRGSAPVHRITNTTKYSFLFLEMPARNNTGKCLSLSDIVHRFKSLTTNRYSKGVKLGLVEPFYKRLWQRNYHDHIIRNEKEFIAIEQYILHNPQNWEQDRLRTREGMMEERGVYGGDWKSYL